MKKEQLDILENNRMAENCIYIPSVKAGKIVMFAEGAGNALCDKDLDEGWEGYIDFTSYDLVFDCMLEIEEHDGGIILIDKPYGEMTMKEIVQTVVNLVKDPDDEIDVETEEVIALDFENLAL